MAAVTASDAPADLDDHALAAWLATTAGERLLAVRESGPTGRAGGWKIRPLAPGQQSGTFGSLLKGYLM